MSESKFKQKSLIITGAGRRLGLQSCQHFLDKGNKVTAVTRKINSELEALTQAHPHSFNICECETYNAAGAAKVATQLTNQSFDVLINNASYFVDDADEGISKAAQYQAFFDVHMMFPMLLSDWFALQEKNTTLTSRVIINMSDIYAVKPAFERSLYCSTKAGLENLTQSLAVKFAPNIRVNSVQPGPLAFLPEHTEVEKTKVIGQTPLATEGGFEVVVKTFDFIIDNQYLTGSSIKVDGGRSLVR